MKILAFLQNPWFRPGTNPLLIKKYRMDPDFHRRVLYMSATGKALYRAFGSELYAHIIWDNACPIHGHTRDARLTADSGHMARTIITHEPDLVICFGLEARRGMSRVRVDREFRVLFSAHPMARGSAAEHLRQISTEVKKLWTKSNSSKK